MPALRVHNLCVSLDGFSAGPDQDEEHPLGVGSQALHRWVFATRYGKQMIGETDDLPEPTVDDEMLLAGDRNVGATIMGRNMFGPVRGDWPDDRWRGWWGPTPPYGHDVFVLTHFEREPLVMEGGTTFHFVTGGINEAYDRAMASADGQDVRLGGGAATIQQYLRAGLVDEINLSIVPVFLGRGERLLADEVAPPEGFDCAHMVTTEHVTHVRMLRT